MWKRININKNLIKAETAKSVLIAMPHKSTYDGYTFWYPLKLVRSGKHSAAVSIVYADNFTFNLKKYGKGKYNRNKIIEEIEIDVDKLSSAFGVTDENIFTAKNLYETHKPEAKEAINIEADESLVDYEDDDSVREYLKEFNSYE